MNEYVREQENLASALEAARVATADFALITDVNQSIVYVSPSFTALTGFDESDLLGENCRVLQGPSTDPATRMRIRETLTLGQVFEGQILNHRKDGSPMWVSLKIIPLRVGSTSSVTHFVSIQRDISIDVALWRQLHNESLSAPITGGSADAADGSAQNVDQKPSMHSEVTSPVEYRQALQSGKIRLHFQPVVDLRDGSVHLFEALARLELPGGRLAYPGEFLPHFEAEDLRTLFTGVLKQALGIIAEWEKQGHCHDVSVNLPPTILTDGTVPIIVQQLLEDHGLHPRRLGLELLESEAICMEEQRTTLRELVRAGAGLAMDDLGSGYSSLLRVSSFPFSAIKLDRGLFHNINDRPVEALCVIATLIQLGRDLKMNVVVEGLEDESLTEATFILGAYLGQGYYLARPMPPEDCLDWVGSFDLGTYLSPIGTPLGALAFQIQFTRLGAAHPSELDFCPLTQFLGRNSAPAEIIKWHMQQHEILGEHTDLSPTFIDWITGKIGASR